MGLALPARVKDDLSRIAEQVAGSVPDARRVPRDNFHLTLSFLGRVDGERIAAIAEAVGEAAAGLVDITTHLEGFGAFPTQRRARVIWAGIADPAGGLAGIAGAVADALGQLGFPREQRAFQPHVTLARFRAPAAVGFPSDVVVPAGRFTIDRITLFESRLGRPAPAYHDLAVFPFRRA